MKTKIIILFLACLSGSLSAQFNRDSLYDQYSEQIHMDSLRRIVVDHNLTVENETSEIKVMQWIANNFHNANTAKVFGKDVISRQRFKLMNPESRNGVSTIAAIVIYDMEILCKEGHYELRFFNFKVKKSKDILLENWIVKEANKDKEKAEAFIEQISQEIKRTIDSFNSYFE